MRLTDDGRGLVEELNYGHNPLAYLCSERRDGQRPVAHELCVICADGVEAMTWKRRALRAEGSRMPNTPGTPRRTVRIADDLWALAQARAEERGENLSDVIRKALVRYVRRR